MAKMDERELTAILAAEKADALSADDASELSAQRTRAMDYYNGDVSSDMPSAPDRSRAVSSDVSDTVEGMLPSLVEIFVGGDEVVKFAPVGEEDVEAAEQETDYVNHVLMEKNDGFMVLYTMIKDALLSKTGIVKVWWETGEREDRETYMNLTDDAYALIVADEEVEIVEHSERIEDVSGAAGGIA